MVPKRHAPPPPLFCTQRSTLAPGQCSAIDAVLKQLKACSRRLQAALSSYRTELQVLERLYYKGKNQHRSALFWQRVAEMRRFGGRVDEMRMEDAVESLRLSFWGEPPTRTTKAVKGPWTHHPNVKPILFVLERCSACCTLIDTAQERLLGAYESFQLMMQTGAFLQLILTFAALASRMSILLTEVKSALEVSWSASYQALQTLFPSEAPKVRMIVNQADRNVKRITATSTPNEPTNEPIDEDLGSSLVRPAGSVVEQQLPLRLKEEVPDTAAFSLTSELQAVRIADESLVESLATQATIVNSTQLSSGAPKRKKAEGEGTKPSKKKKKKRDEIDDIFGF